MSFVVKSVCIIYDKQKKGNMGLKKARKRKQKKEREIRKRIVYLYI